MVLTLNRSNLFINILLIINSSWQQHFIFLSAYTKFYFHCMIYPFLSLILSLWYIYCFIILIKSYDKRIMDQSARKRY